MKSVLIVDDSKIFQKLIARQVSGEMAVLGFASDGNEGFEKFKQLNPDLVLLDVTMPNCSGKECLKLILGHSPTAKVIMVSGISDDATTKECLAIGALAFVTKDTVTADQSASGILISQIQKICPFQSMEAKEAA